ncbi:copper homeostasis protein CutC [Lapidilactobacillus gannanensis]|jgi:copper homeostasis protein|uniref:PF03932 family protein CutC n=1 Tax=Lapidilactobacillus gannanensis TaxID=2486002 RepID=A0ABW4BPH4_9LACO|nr:copper homeostasis protein CutC [Lapidilactobacillus gannanensis]MCH4056647.1 copper homeostasis protein CutC [Lactobacillaceae bacterium]
MLKEVAVENYTLIPRAVAVGAQRIELNDNLAVGGTTVSHGVMAEAARYLNEKQIPLVAMIRPRGGNFVYNDTELKMMESDLFVAQQLGVDAVTFGALTVNHELDTEAMEMLIGAAGGLDIVMHMAFDEIPVNQQAATIDWLVAHHVQRILTHGGPLTVPIEQHLAQLAQTVALAADRIEILPGGGITADNAEQIGSFLGVNQLHGTKILGALE